MLQRVKTIVGQFRSVRVTKNSEDAAIMFRITLHRTWEHYPMCAEANPARVEATEPTHSKKLNQRIEAGTRINQPSRNYFHWLCFNSPAIVLSSCSRANGLDRNASGGGTD